MGLRSWAPAARASSSIGRKERLGGYGPGAGWDSELADKVPETGVVVHKQDARLAITDHEERVRHAPGHGDPMPRSDQKLLVATAHDHLAFEDVPGVIEVVVDVQRGRRADWQSHLEHDGIHSGCTTVLNDQGVEEPPRRPLFVLGGVNNCRRHVGHLLVGNLSRIG